MPFQPADTMLNRQTETNNAWDHIGETHRSTSADSGPDQFTHNNARQKQSHMQANSQLSEQEEASDATSAPTASTMKKPILCSQTPTWLQLITLYEASRPKK